MSTSLSSLSRNGLLALEGRGLAIFPHFGTALAGQSFVIEVIAHILHTERSDVSQLNLHDVGGSEIVGRFGHDQWRQHLSCRSLAWLGSQVHVWLAADAFVVPSDPPHVADVRKYWPAPGAFLACIMMSVQCLLCPFCAETGPRAVAGLVPAEHPLCKGDA